MYENIRQQQDNVDASLQPSIQKLQEIIEQQKLKYLRDQLMLIQNMTNLQNS